MRGKLLDGINAVLAKKDHPRGCGENSNGQSRTRLCPGSPPRMRGKLEEESNAYRYKRITPADAGKTLFRRQRVAGHKDHPRGCGENQPTAA